MEFFAKAAAVALSVLASIFSNVEAPMAKANAAPVVSKASLPRPTTVVVYRARRSAEGQPMNVVFNRPQTTSEPLDPQSARFLAWIGSAQPGTKPIAAAPWYAQTDSFMTPSVRDTADVLRALITGERESL